MKRPSFGVSGATGFIGRILVDLLLARGAEVRILTRRLADPLFDRPGVVVCRGDIADRAAWLGFAGVDAVFNLAGELHDEGQMHRVHVVGTEAGLDACVGRTGRFVHLSSVGVYGRVRDGIVDESAPFAPEGPYERTKAEADNLVRERSSSSQVTVLRPTIVYGPGMPNSSVFGLIDSVRRGRFAYIGSPRRGDTEPVANYVHVNDVARALDLLGSHPAAVDEAFNIGEPCPLTAAIDAIAEAAGVATPRKSIPVPAARLVARTAGRVRGFPLTSTRVDALTSSAVYSDDKIRSLLGFDYGLSTPEGFAHLARLAGPSSRTRPEAPNFPGATVGDDVVVPQRAKE